MTWSDLSNAAWGFVGGVAGWITTTFLVQPISAVFAARSEAAQSLAKFEVCDWHQPLDEDVPPVSDELIEERRKAYVDCGARLVGFDLSYPWFYPWLGRFGFNFRSAGNNLIMLGRHSLGSPYIQTHRTAAMAALRLGRSIGRSRLRGRG